MTLVTHPKETIWTERFRPIKIQDCVLPNHIKTTFEGYVKQKDIPHLMLSGGQGQGKTTIARALCNELEFDYILLNLSKERGIEVLRTTISQFASSVSLSGNKKCIILDEFDGATPEFQNAFKGFMEAYSQNTRFILTCNHSNRIIQPIHSRCSVIDFQIDNKDRPNLAKQMLDRVIEILKIEGIVFERAALAVVITKYFPDYRRTLNELQRYASSAGKIDQDIVKYCSSNNIDDLVTALKTANFKEARKWLSVNVSNRNHDSIFRELYDKMYDLIDPQSIPALIILIADYQYRCVNAPDIELQMAAFCIQVMQDVQFNI